MSVLMLLAELAPTVDGTTVAKIAANVVLWPVSAFAGGTVGAFVWGMIAGKWRQKVDHNADDIAEIKARLAKGDDSLADLPALKSEIHALTDEMRETRKALAQLVTRRECDLRHRKDAG